MFEEGRRRMAEARIRVGERAQREGNPSVESAPRPVSADSRNVLRPTTFAEIIGQDTVKALLTRMVGVANRERRPLDHALLIGRAGIGKTTFATACANELHSQAYQVEAPVSYDTLLNLRSVMSDRDVLLIDEIHLQAIPERRGRSAGTTPEVLFSLLEDFVLLTQQGRQAFPHITVMGATTDPGLLPAPFLDRFPIRPRLAEYAEWELVDIAYLNADRLGVDIDVDAALIFARACNGTPRQMNSFMRNCKMLGEHRIRSDLATEVVTSLNGFTLDGLTPDQQAMLKFLYLNGRQVRGDGRVSYQASVMSIATGIGLARDMKAVQLHVEPSLIVRGYVTVAHRGRLLTDAGIQRARELLA